jgi:alpha-methylacyl-CoA racemase
VEPLAGIRVVEFAGIGPTPFCGMLLADMGADVVRVDRVAAGPGNLPPPLQDIAGRGRRSLAVDLKDPRGVAVVLRLVETADALIEGYRPGVMERLGLGPAVCAERNPSLVYGRMTGWGQEGPLARRAGHDINYIGLAGVLGAVGSEDRPVPPLNLVGDYGGGALYLAVGVLAALVARAATGRGEIVDTAMVDGAASLMTPIYQLFARGLWRARRDANVLDGGAPFYRAYRTADGGWMAVGALEPQFYAELLSGLGLGDEELPDQMDVAGWPVLHEVFAAAFATRTRDEWEARFAGTDACVTPVLSMEEAPRHPHHVARGAFLEGTGGAEPAPAPRFGGAAGRLRSAPDHGEHSAEVLAELGYDEEERRELVSEGVVGEP